MTKSKNLFKNISIFLCLVPMLVLSIFCLVPPKDNLNVAAAEVTNNNQWFWGYTINVPITTTSTSGAYDLTTIFSANCSFGFEDGAYKFQIDGSYLRKDLTTIRTVNHRFTIDKSGYSSAVYDLSIPGASGYIFQVRVDCGLNYLQPHLVDRVTTNTGTNLSFTSGYTTNSITYSDGTATNYMRFIFQRNYSHFGSLGSSADIFYYYDLSYDTYFFDLVTDDLEGSVYYQDGYNAGYVAGVTDGSSIGYQDGYNAGVGAGYVDGYNAGVEYGGDYSFSSLFGAVIDVPVNAFKSLMNFELFGVNLLGLFTGLLSVAIIVLIVKLCMGGK